MKYIFTHYENNLNNTGITCFFNSILSLNREDIVVYFFTNTDVPDYWNKYKFLQVIKNLNKKIDLRPQVNRWFHYRNFLEKNITLFKPNDSFVTIDCADSIFQKNIFEEVEEKNKILFALESSGFNLKQGFNKRCILNLLDKNINDPIIQKFIYNPIICAGTIYYDNLLLFSQFLTWFTTETLLYLVKNNNFYDEKFKLGKCNDQGILNTGINISNVPFKYSLIKNEYFNLYATIALMLEDKNNYNFIINHDNYIEINNNTPCIIHQYNRAEDLTLYINKKYGG